MHGDNMKYRAFSIPSRTAIYLQLPMTDSQTTFMIYIYCIFLMQVDTIKRSCENDDEICTIGYEPVKYLVPSGGTHGNADCWKGI